MAMSLALCLLLSGCAPQAKQPKAADVYAAIQAANLLPDMVAVPEGSLLDFYGIDSAWYQDAVFMLAADSLRADEVIILRAKETAAAAQIEKMLGERMAAKAEEALGYSPEQHAIILRGKLIREGLNLALLVSPQIEQLQAVYAKQF